jgi:hypothetical protein
MFGLLTSSSARGLPCRNSRAPCATWKRICVSSNGSSEDAILRWLIGEKIGAQPSSWRSHSVRFEPAVSPNLLQNAPLYQAQTAEANQNAAKTAQDVQARTKLLNNVPAIAAATGLDPVLLQSLPPEQLATIATQASTPTEASKNFKQARQQLASQGYSQSVIDTLAPPELLISGASADPAWRDYTIQNADALKSGTPPASVPNFSQLSLRLYPGSPTLKM